MYRCLVCVLMVIFLQLVKGSPPPVYVSNVTHILSYTRDRPEVDVVLGQDGYQIVGLAVDLGRNYMFWSDTSQKFYGIYRSDLTGNNITVITKDVGEVYGLSVDWVSRHMYWTDKIRGTVEVANYDGSGRRILVSSDLKSPQAILADPIVGFLFWVNYNPRRIERSLLDGSHRRTIYKASNIQPNQLAVSHKTKLLYWVDAKALAIYSCKLNGKECKKQINYRKITRGYPGFGLIVFGNTAVVSTWMNTAIYSMLLNSKKLIWQQETKNLGHRELFSMVSLNRATQPMTFHPCMEDDRAGCSHLCLPAGKKSKIKCTCPTYGGLAMYTDKCSQGPNSSTCKVPCEVLLFTSEETGDVGFISPDTSAAQDVHLISKSSSPSAVTYDAAEKMVYWSDSAEKAIYSARFDGNEKLVFLNSNQGIGVVNSLAFSEVTASLYFTNAGTHHSWQRVEMVSVHSGDRLTILQDLDYPVAIVVDSEYLYTLDVGRTPRILRTELDGSNPVTLTDIPLVNPFGLDLFENSLYVADYQNSTTVSLLQYNLLTKTLNETEITWKDRATSFTMVPNGVYFTDNEQGQIVAFNGTSTYSVLSNGKNSGVKYALTSTTVDEKHDHISECINFGCSHGCVPLPKGSDSKYRCTCPDHSTMVLSSDGKTCARPENFLLYTSFATINLVSLDEGMSSRPVTLLYGNSSSSFTSLQYDAVKDRIYWVEILRNEIYLTNLHRLEPMLLYKEKGTIDSLVFDSSRQRLYWSGYNNTDTGFIASLNLRSEDTYKKILTNRNQPKALTLHPNGKWLYWVERIPGVLGAKIYSCKHNGHRLREVIPRGLYWPSSILLTYDEIYISEISGKILVSNLEGESIEEVYSTPKQVFGWQLLENLLFYSEWKASTIYMVDMFTMATTPLVTNITQPTSLVLHHPGNMSDICYHDNGSTCTGTCTPYVRGMYDCQEETTTTTTTAATTTTTSTTTTATTTTTAKATTTTTPATSEDNLINHISSTSAIYIASGDDTLLGDEYGYDYPDSLEYIEIPRVEESQNPTTGITFSTTPDTTHVKDYAEPKPTPSTRKQFIEGSPAPTAEIDKRVYKEDLVEDGSIRVEPLAFPRFENCPSSPVQANVPATSSRVEVQILPTGYDSFGSVLPLHSNYEMTEHGILVQWKGKENNSSHHIMFKVTDSNLMEAICEFDVILNDVDPPKFTYCPRNIKVGTTVASENVNWDDPEAVDNVGIRMISGTYADQRHFPAGESVVNYTAEDFAGNKAFCTFRVTVIHDKLCNLPEINHGGIVCLHGDKTDGDCSVICETGYVVNPIRTFRRTFNCMHPDDIDALTTLMRTQQPCLNQRYPSVIQQEFRLLFHGPINKHQEEVISFLSVAISEHLEKKKLCTQGICQIGNLTIPCELEQEIEGKNESCFENIEREKFFITFNVTLMNTTSPAELDMNRLLKDIHLELMSLSSLLQLQLEDQLFMAISDSLSTTDITWSCPLGQISENNICIACPPGTLHNVTLDICQYCNMGQYQDKEGQVICNLCDPGQTSPDGATTPSQCHTIPSMDEMTLFVIVTACSFGVVFLCMAITLYLQFKRQQKRNQKASSQKKTRYNMSPNIYVAPPPILKSKLDENLSPGQRTYSIDKKHPINIYNNHDYEDPDRSPNSAPQSVFQNEMFHGSPGQVRRSPREYSPMEEVPTGTLSRENTFNNSTYSPLFSVKRSERGSQKGSPIAQRKMSHDSTFSSYSPGMMRTQGTPTSDTPLITQSPLLRLKLAAYNLNHED